MLTTKALPTKSTDRQGWRTNRQPAPEVTRAERKNMKRSKKTFTAKAILKDETHEWEVTIYSDYETRQAAEEGIERFSKHGYNIVKTWIE